MTLTELLAETLATKEDEDREVNTPAQGFATLQWRSGLVKGRPPSYPDIRLIGRTPRPGISGGSFVSRKHRSQYALLHSQAVHTLTPGSVAVLAKLTIGRSNAGLRSLGRGQGGSGEHR